MMKYDINYRYIFFKNWGIRGVKELKTSLFPVSKSRYTHLWLMGTNKKFTNAHLAKPVKKYTEIGV